MLARHENSIEHTMQQLPPFAAFKRWGVHMPAVSINDQPLRQRLASMHERFRHYPHLYSGSFFEPYCPSLYRQALCSVPFFTSET